MNILEISDGTFANTVSLLGNPSGRGLRLHDYEPTQPQLKSDGVYQESPYSVGRDLVFGALGNLNEVLTVTITGKTQIEVINHSRRLKNLLEFARSYWTSKWQLQPVRVKMQVCESNLPLYGTIVNYTWRSLGNPFAAPFFNNDAPRAFERVIIGLELRPWQAMPPGTGRCVAIGSTQEWFYDSVWTLIAPVGMTDALNFIQSTTGRLFAGDFGNVFYSDNDGLTWAVSTAAPISNVWALLQTNTGRILAGDFDRRIWKTDNDGAAWAQLVLMGVGDSPYDFIQTRTGRIVMAGVLGAAPGVIYYSDDNGATWHVSAWSAGTPASYTYSLCKLASGRLLAGGEGFVFYSDDDALTWTVIPGLSNLDLVTALLQTSSGRILAGANFNLTTPRIYFSDDEGLTWGWVSTLSYPYDFFQAADGTIYCCEDDYVRISVDDGLTWKTVYTVTGGSQSRAGMQTAAGTILVEDDDIARKANSVATLGASQAGCDDRTFIVNKQNVANVTHIYIDDGGAFSANLFPLALPTTLLPAVPAVNDALYIGSRTAIINSGLFTSLVFDLSSIVTFDTSYTILPEYYTGAAWATLTLQDGTNPGDGVFRNFGVNSMHWAPPANWATVAVNGVTGYWVRFRVSALVGTMTPPVQQNRDIYSVVNSWVEAAATAVVGELPALTRLKLNNRSDKDGVLGSGLPQLFANRLQAGLRSYDRGSQFQAFINISDVQNPTGITISVGTNTAFANDVQAPTGRCAVYNPGGAEAMATRATIVFGPTIASHFFGAFHAALRVQRTSDVYTTFLVRLQIVSGSGGVQTTTSAKYVLSTTQFEVLDFGLINIPAGQQLNATDYGDTSEIRIQVSAVNGTPNLNLYDLSLIPVDESFVDGFDNALEIDSEVGASGNVRKLWDADSVTSPKVPLSVAVRAVGSELKTAQYVHSSAGALIMQTGEQQRWHFFAMQALLTGVHNGGAGAATLTDTTTNFLLCGVEPGMIAYNTTDGSTATITAVTATTVVGTLSAGTWDVNDVYVIICPHWVAPPGISHSVQALVAERFTIPRGEV